MKKIIALLSLLVLVGFGSCSSVKDGNNGKVNGDFLRIGTFNIEWLGDGFDDRKPRTDKDYKRIADFLNSTEVDILGVEEIENDAALSRIVKEMPGYSFKLIKTDKEQNAGLIYKNEIQVSNVEIYNQLAVEAGRTRPAFVADVKVKDFDFKVMVLHLKSTSRYDSTDELRKRSYELRKMQSQVVNNFADSIITKTNEQDVIILGDFNDNPNKKHTDILTIKNNPNLSFLTDGLKSCKNPKWENIDHVIVSQSVKKRYNERTLTVYNLYDKFTASEAEMISDHCPVIIGLDLNLGK